MKSGNCYIDKYYEPETIVLKVSSSIGPDGYDCTVVYSSDSYYMKVGDKIRRYSNDEELIPAAMITIDKKLMIIKL
jgi:hypothetical protein